MKVCEMCGAQNDDVFTKCAVCGADLPSANSQDGDDEKTVLINPDQVAEQPSGLSLKTDTSTYGQADAAQTNPQPAAPQYGGMGQPQMNGMGMNGMPQQGMPGQAPYGQPGFGGPAAQPQPAKPKKGLIIGIIAAAVALLAVAFVLIFKGGVSGTGASSAEDVAKQFIEAMDEKDADKMAKLCPPFLDPGKEDIEDMIDMYDGYDVTFTYEGISSKEDYEGDDLKDLQDDVSDYAGKNVKLQDACDLEFSFNIKMSYLGENYDESSTYTITCIKYKGNWYLYE